MEIDVPDGIIAHLTKECGGNVHARQVVEVTSRSFENETEGINPHSGAYDNEPYYAAKNAVDLETDSYFHSAYRTKKEDIPHTRNNWICYDFKERRIVPTHYTIRTNNWSPGYLHLKSWIVATSADGENWREAAREEDSKQLNGRSFSTTFAIAGAGEWRCIRLVNIGRNPSGSDQLVILRGRSSGTSSSKRPIPPMLLRFPPARAAGGPVHPPPSSLCLAFHCPSASVSARIPTAT
jgi:hypothetical protein